MKPLTLPKIMLLLLVASSLFSCRTQNLFGKTEGRRAKSGIQYPSKEDSLAFAIDSSYEYKIRINDKINISIWDHDDLSVGSLYGIYNSNEVYGKWLMVNHRGEINVPKIGNFKIKDLSLTQAEDSLRSRFSEWIKNPVVNVKVLNKEVTVMGEMKNPGIYLVEKENNSLLELLARAGNFEQYADMEKIKVLRSKDNKTRAVSLNLTLASNYDASNIQILPGDIIIVPSRKGKYFDKKISTAIPFISMITAFAISYGTFF